MSRRSLAQAWVERDLERGDLTFLREFALFRNRRPPSAVIDRLRERGFLTKTARERTRITLKGWIERLSREATTNVATALNFAIRFFACLPVMILGLM